MKGNKEENDGGMERGKEREHKTGIEGGFERGNKKGNERRNKKGNERGIKAEEDLKNIQSGMTCDLERERRGYPICVQGTQKIPSIIACSIN